MKKLWLSNDLEWMRPYINRVKRIVPLHKLEKIVSVKPVEHQVQHHLAQCVTETIEGKVSRTYISINLYYWRLARLQPLERKFDPFSKLDLLELLGHELAHLVDTDHTVRHKKLEVRMISLFMTLLDRTGYVSEEYEMKHNKPRFHYD